MKKAVIAVAVAGIASASAAGYDGSGSKAEVAQGLNNVAQGVAQVGKAAMTGVANKADKFIDSAGNVYTVLKDASGAATNFVMDAAGAIIDVTKLAGSFLIDNALAYPGELAASARESHAELQAALANGMDAAGALGGFAMKAMPELPPLNQLHKPSAWKTAATNSFNKAGGAMGDIELAFSETWSEWEDKYCKPAKFTPSRKVKAKLVMPSFELTIGLGGCTVVEGGNHKDGYNLDCVKPYMNWEHKNGTLTSKFHAPPKFTAKECKYSKSHGEDDSVVLFEFAHETPDLKSLSQQVSQQVGSAVGSLAQGATNLASDMSGFMSGMKKDKPTFDEFVKSYEGLPNVEL